MKKILCLLLLVFVAAMATKTTVRKTHAPFVSKYYPNAGNVARQSFEGILLQTDTFVTSPIFNLHTMKAFSLYVNGLDSVHMVVLGRLSGIGNGTTNTAGEAPWFRIMDTIKTSGYKSLSSYLPLASIKILTCQPLAVADTVPLKTVVNTPETTITGTDTLITVDTVTYRDSGISVWGEGFNY